MQKWSEISRAMSSTRKKMKVVNCVSRKGSMLSQWAENCPGTHFSRQLSHSSSNRKRLWTSLVHIRPIACLFPLFLKTVLPFLTKCCLVSVLGSESKSSHPEILQDAAAASTSPTSMLLSYKHLQHTTREREQKGNVLLMLGLIPAGCCSRISGIISDLFSEKKSAVRWIMQWLKNKFVPQCMSSFFSSEICDKKAFACKAMSARFYNVALMRQ